MKLETLWGTSWGQLLRLNHILKTLPNSALISAESILSMLRGVGGYSSIKEYIPYSNRL
jgi:hypothetical protein